MAITYHKDFIQGTEEWHKQRIGLLTASEMKFAISKKTDRKTGAIIYKSPDDDKAVAHLYELAAQRITQYVEPTYIGDNMLRGQDDESHARETYHEKYAPVETMGFITNDKFSTEELNIVIGESPDGLVGEDGCVECKSRKQKFQMETIHTDEVPDEYIIQIQTGLLVSERKWCDFISYSGGMPMFVKRVYPDAVIQEAITNAVWAFHVKLDAITRAYPDKIKGLIPTERRATEISI